MTQGKQQWVTAKGQKITQTNHPDLWAVTLVNMFGKDKKGHNWFSIGGTLGSMMAMYPPVSKRETTQRYNG